MPEISSPASDVQRLTDRMFAECDPVSIFAAGEEAAPRRVGEVVRRFIADERRVLSRDRETQIVEEIVARTIGLGPLDALLADETIAEIMVNGADQIFVERNGVIESTQHSFDNEEHVRRVLDRILAPIGRRLDSLSPFVDARLANGCRVNAVIPPLSYGGTTITIRRFLHTMRSLDDLHSAGAINSVGLDAIRSLVTSRSNVVVAGATSSGKTTLVGAALALASDQDRIVVIEDSLELPIDHNHIVRLEARQETVAGQGAVSIRDLVRNAMRMRPDRLIIGEVRGSEAFDLVQALNTGHRGCWTTVHANSAIDALERMETLALMAGVGVPLQVIRGQLSRSVDAVVYVARTESGKRVVDSISTLELSSDGFWQSCELWSGK